MGARDYEALAVGLAIGVYGLVGFKYLLVAIGKYADKVRGRRPKIILGCLWFSALGVPVLLAGVWLSLQPLPRTTWYVRLIWPALAIALIIAGIREAISSAAQTGSGQTPPS